MDRKPGEKAVTEDDLTKAQAWKSHNWGLSAALREFNVDFNVVQTFNDGRPNQFGQASLDKEDGAAMCNLAADLLTERLKDIDATLRAFGCEPPKDTAAAMAKLRP
jgi:hypothetical protein